MALAFYIYTILILLLCAGSAMTSLSAYFVSRKPAFLLALFFFLFYFLDVALIFQFEYTGQNIGFSPALFYAVDYPQVKIVIATGVLEALWLIVCDYLDAKGVTLKAVPAVAFALACLATILFMPAGKWQQWVFYTWRQVFLLWVLMFAAFVYLRSPEGHFRMRLARYRRLWLVVLVFAGAITGEDVLMILVWEPAFDASLLPLYLSQRNFSENL
ncbi:MAG: hypothetical protein LBG81_06440, partial [Coriobacteriaceae bacterium]|nr:hypothetical protein [Coriobacteriaceae bacterium]